MRLLLWQFWHNCLYRSEELFISALHGAHPLNSLQDCEPIAPCRGAERGCSVCKCKEDSLPLWVQHNNQNQSQTHIPFLCFSMQHGAHPLNSLPECEPTMPLWVQHNTQPKPNTRSFFVFQHAAWFPSFALIEQSPTMWNPLLLLHLPCRG